MLHSRNSRLIVALLAMFSFAPSPANAMDGHPLGLGIVLGEPTGLSGKYWMDVRAALDFGLAFDLNDDYFVLFSDYLYHFPGSFGHQAQFISQMNPYIGVGAVLVFGANSGGRFSSGSSSAGFGVRIPLGIEWRPTHPRIGVFVELVPGLALIPSTSGFAEGGVGIRYFF